MIYSDLLFIVKTDGVYDTNDINLKLTPIIIFLVVVSDEFNEIRRNVFDKVVRNVAIVVIERQEDLLYIFS